MSEPQFHSSSLFPTDVDTELDGIGPGFEFGDVEHAEQPSIDIALRRLYLRVLVRHRRIKRAILRFGHC